MRGGAERGEYVMHVHIFVGWSVRLEVRLRLGSRLEHAM
jgi:hypothetical protein